MCCKLPAITYMDPPKPMGQWCRHCRPGKGCAIWNDRPEGCDTFNCDWRKNAKLGDEWRPDRAGFLLNRSTPSSPYEVLVDATRPDAWRKEPYYSGLKRAAAFVAEQGSTILVVVGGRRWLVLPDKDVAIPPEHYESEYLISRESGLPGGRWRVMFAPRARAS
jgi:hypothetical protein